MAQRFTGQRCQDCQGGLVYIKAEKYWECPYCGKIYERELRFDKIQIDGLAGINDLIRSTLSKLISLDFSGAEKDLTECEKINHACAGTQIAAMSVALFKSFHIKERQTELTRANTYLQKLNRDYPDIDEPEEILYDFIDSPDIYGLLYTVYSMTNQTRRKELIFEMLDCAGVYNANVIKFLLNVLLKDQYTDEADLLIDKIPAASCRASIPVILTNYPSNANKARQFNKLMGKVNSDVDMSKTFNSYFSETTDASDVIVDIFLSAISHNMSFDTALVINSVLKNCNTVENATHIFDAIGEKRLEENTSSAVLNWCIEVCRNSDITMLGFRALFESKSVFEITDAEIMKILGSDQTEKVKQEKVVQMLDTFKMSGKNMDRVLSYHLNENIGSFEYRKVLFNYLASKVVSIPLSVFESYVLNVSLDGEDKHILVSDAFKKSKNIPLGASIFSQYLKKNVDTPKSRDLVISAFLTLKIMPDPEAVNAYLLNQNELHTDKVLDLMITNACKARSDTFDRYLCGTKNFKLYNFKIAKIATRFGFVLSARAFTNYLLYVSEPGSQKAAAALKYFAACNGDLRSTELTATICGNEIKANLAQVYLFIGRDDIFVMQEILTALKTEKIKLDAPIELLATRKKVKLHKFIDSFASHLDKKVETLAQQLL